MVDDARGEPVRDRVAVVTGGGGGIGSEIALELARRGAAVVVVDPGVGVTGEPLREATAAATVRRIEESGGTAMAATVSVTDLDAVRALFDDVVTRFGRVDIVVNTAGIIRFPRIADSSDDDWSALLGVHLDGYLNVLSVALPLMAGAGYGRVVGVTSGVGLGRTSVDGPAYGCAKRAVAALTWQLGPSAPEGVTINALSPIAATRMVREGLLAAGADPKGLDLSAMPQPESMAPAAAHLAGESFGWCTGQIVFSAGSELSLMAPPRLLEAVRTDGAADVASTLSAVVPAVLGPAEERQRTTGGSNPRFEPTAGNLPADTATALEHRCLVVSDDAEVAGTVGRALAAWGYVAVDMAPGGSDFDAAEGHLRAAAASGRIDAIVVAVRWTGRAAADGEPRWQHVLRSHDGTAQRIREHAAWSRAVVRHAAAENHPMRIVHIVPTDSPGGRSAAQAVAQLTRSVRDTPAPTAVDGFSVGVDGVGHKPLADLVARLVGAEDTRALSGAELVFRDRWLGLRAHPRPVATASFEGLAIPGWVDDVLREAITPQA